MDCIHITGIRSYGYTGLLPEEQVLGQWFEVELTLWLDLSVAGESDRLEDTLDYCGIITGVQQQMSTAKYALIERLASAIASNILQRSAQPQSHPPITQVKVRLTKLTPPIPNFGGTVSIELTRRYGESSVD
ncbi:dihydroneopterin aldolase [Geitlerinema splendidum]|nr:dihydroneopterin aldolase [Geitlerinema splendidum]